MERLTKAATEAAEGYTGRALITQSWVMTLDCFPGRIVIPRPPLVTIDSIKYVQDSDGVLTTLDSSLYRVSTYTEPGTVEPEYNESWPTPRSVSEAVQIAFTCGYGATDASVPDTIKQGILLILGEMDEYREGVMPNLRVIPHAAEYWLNRKRIGRLFAGTGIQL